MAQLGLLQIGDLSIEVKVALLFILVTAAAWFDIKSRRIPNWLVLVGLISSFIFQTLFHSSGGFGGFKAWGLGLMVGFGLFLPLYVLHAMGAGDVKLIAMVGAFLGPMAALGVVLTTLIVGGFLALAVVLWRGSTRQALGNVRLVLTQTMLKTLPGGVQIEAPSSSAGNLPYAVAIAAGTLIHLILERSGHALFV